MDEHLSPEDLDAFVAGRLSEERARAAVRHLLTGCRACGDAISARLPILRRPSPRALSRKEEGAYDRAIGRATTGAYRQAARERRETALYDEALRRYASLGIHGVPGAPARLRGLAGIRALLDLSWACRREDPNQMVGFALFASLLAARLDPQRFGATEVADLRCRCDLELANAYRAADDLDQAGRYLQAAEKQFRQGSRSDSLKARLFDVKASIHGDSRRFATAFRALKAVQRIHEKAGDDHMTGRALISQGMYRGYQGKAEEALRLTREGRALLDEQRDPALFGQAIHNEVYLLVDLGECREARTLLWSNLWRYQDSGAFEQVKLRGLQARINAGIGQLDWAVRDFLAAKKGLEEAGLPYLGAIANLDLAAVYLQQGRTGDAKALALEAIATFERLGIHQEVLSGLHLLEEVIDREILTVQLLRRYADILRHVEHLPAVPPSREI